MPVNSDKVHQWKEDVRRSVDFYNDWFMRFAPEAYRTTRKKATESVVAALKATSDLTDIKPNLLQKHPNALKMLRMATAPPLAQDRLVGLAGVSKNLVTNMEDENRVPPKMPLSVLNEQLERIGNIIEKLADRDIFIWLGRTNPPSDAERERAGTIVADRLCGAISDPIIRNAQEQRQLALIKDWLTERGYKEFVSPKGATFRDMPAGTFAFRLNVVVTQSDGRKVNIPMDAVINPTSAKPGDMPLFVEAKSAGDFTNTNKRRKEEATKVIQLRNDYGTGVRFVLFLCGYFDSGYLGYEAAEGIDWVWEHRIEDFVLFGL